MCPEFLFFFAGGWLKPDFFGRRCPEIPIKTPDFLKKNVYLWVENLNNICCTLKKVKRILLSQLANEAMRGDSDLTWGNRLNGVKLKKKGSKSGPCGKNQGKKICEHLKMLAN